MIEDVLQTAETVVVTASRKKQFGQYEPAESGIEIEGDPSNRPEGMTVQEYAEALQIRAGELAHEDIMRRYNEYVQREIESDDSDE
jgi:hypothetical protein